MKHKKTQFYMFAGVILISYVFFIVANKSSISTSEVKNLEIYLDNYVYEAKIVINNAIYENKNISNELNIFTESFITYAESKNIGLGILSLYSNDNQIFIANYLNDFVMINGLTPVLNKAEERVVDYNNIVTIEYRNETYYYHFSNPNEIELKTLFIKENG